MTSVEEQRGMAVAMGPRPLCRRIGAKVLLAAAAVCAAIATAGPGRAEAGNYHFYACDGTYQAAPDAIYFTNAQGFPYPGQINCDDPGLQIRDGAPISVAGAGASWNFYAPYGVWIRHAWLRYNLNSVNGHVAYVTMSNGSGEVAHWQSPEDSWAGGEVPDANNLLFATSLSGLVYCPSGSCPLNTAAHTWLKWVHLEMEDIVRPAITGLSGSLITSGTHRGIEDLTIAASDTGGGISRIRMWVNDSLYQDVPGGCALDGSGRAVRIQPCPGSVGVPLSVNTEEPPWHEGQNGVRICVYDFANGGSNAPWDDCRDLTITIDNSCPKSVGTTQATGLTAGLESKGSGNPQPRLAVRSTEGATVRGTLSNAGGGVGGATMCLFERIDRDGEGNSLIETAYTRPNGTYSMTVEPGPSRVYDVVYRFNNQVVEKRGLYLDSAVVPTLRIRPKHLSNGENARFSGDIPGPYAGDRGISMQARAGKKWRTFKQLKTDEKGRFKGRYKFTHTSGRVLYVFRALVKKQGGYPYGAGNSRKRKVVVSG